MKKMVPQTDKQKAPNGQHIQQEFNFDAIRLEPDLQIEVCTMPPEERRALAVRFIRWAHQLEVSANVLERQSVPWKRRSLPRISPCAIRLN